MLEPGQDGARFALSRRCWIFPVAVRGICDGFPEDYARQKYTAGEPPTELWDALAGKGYLGVNLPEEWGGGVPLEVAGRPFPWAGSDRPTAPAPTAALACPARVARRAASLGSTDARPFEVALACDAPTPSGPAPAPV